MSFVIPSDPSGIRKATGCAVILLVLAGCERYVRPPQPSDAAAVQLPRSEDGKVLLGSAELTRGIPGEGSLTVAEIEAWLAQPAHHQPLEVALPLGLSDAADRIHIPAENPLTLAKIELGRQLFFERRLSRNDVYNCAECHKPEESYASRVVMPVVERNPHAVINRILSREQFWDGRGESLETQPLIPIITPYEMDTTPQHCAARIRAVTGYRLQFEKIFGEVTFENICKALASFERVLVTLPSPYDYHRIVEEYRDREPDSLSPAEAERYQRALAGAKEHPLSPSALRGKELFFSERTGCSHCHSGPNFTDEGYHNLGVGYGVRSVDTNEEDLGRYRATHQDEDRHLFRTPTLRNVALTAPYMHNGRLETLAEVIDFFDAGGKDNPGLSPLLRPLGLTEAEKRDLLAFLESLTSPLPPVETGRLPE